MNGAAIAGATIPETQDEADTGQAPPVQDSSADRDDRDPPPDLGAGECETDAAEVRIRRDAAQGGERARSGSTSRPRGGVSESRGRRAGANQNQDAPATGENRAVWRPAPRSGALARARASAGRRRGGGALFSSGLGGRPR